MINLIKKIYSQHRQFWLYCIGGTLAFIVDFGLLYVLTDIVGLWYLLSATISVIVAIVVNYSWQRSVTFKKHENLAKQFTKFVVISLVGIGLNIILLYIFVDIVGLWYLLAKAIVSVIVLIWNFFGNKYYTFS